MTLERKYFRKSYTFDACALAKTRSLALPYRNTLEQVIRTKKIADIRTEQDMLYIPFNNDYLWIAAVPDSLHHRAAMLNYGTTHLKEHASGAIVWKRDKDLFSVPAREVGEFAVLGDARMQEQVISILEN